MGCSKGILPFGAKDWNDALISTKKYLNFIFLTQTLAWMNLKLFIIGNIFID